MKKAVEEVNGGKAIRQVAKEFTIPYPTLRRYVVLQKNRPNNNSITRFTPHYDNHKVFTTDQEKELVNYLLTCSKMCFALDTKTCRRLAYELASKNNLNFPDNWNTGMAGIDWFYAFMKRNPSLSIRTPEGCSLSRATSFNRHNVSVFFNNLENVLNRYPSLGDGTAIFNLDETSTSTVPEKLPKILTQKGIKQVPHATSGERGVLVTTCCIISAGGTFLPPTMVFPRVHFKQYMINNAPPGTLGLATKTGWMNSELFVEVMKHFIRCSNSSKEKPTLLILDNHESHLSIEAVDLAKENGVIMLTIPPHTSNRLQPLDVGVFSSFKSNYYSALNSKLLQNKGVPLTIYDVAGCVKIAHDRAMTPSNIAAAFKKTGIFPFDSNIFTDDDFMVSEVTNRPAPENSTTSSALFQEMALASEPATSSIAIDVEPDNRLVNYNQKNSKNNSDDAKNSSQSATHGEKILLFQKEFLPK